MSVKIEETLESLRESREFAVSYYQPLHGFLDKAIKELSSFSDDEYDFYEVFTDDLIENDILENALPFLQASVVNGKVTSVISSNPGGAKQLDHSDMIPLYLRVLSEWEEKGFISIECHEENRAMPIAVKILPKPSANT